MRQRLVRTRRPMRGGLIRQVRALDSIGLSSEVERRPTVIADLDENGDGVTLSYEGKCVIFPPQATEAVRSCFESEGPFRPEDLAGDLDAAGRLVLVRRLVREGFLQLTGPERHGTGRRSAADEPA
jgi:hypothetical protein